MSVDLKEALARLEADFDREEAAANASRKAEAWDEYDHHCITLAQTGDLLRMAKRLLADDGERMPTENDHWPRPTSPRLVRTPPRPSSVQAMIDSAQVRVPQGILNEQFYATPPSFAPLTRVINS